MCTFLRICTLSKLWTSHLHQPTPPCLVTMGRISCSTASLALCREREPEIENLFSAHSDHRTQCGLCGFSTATVPALVLSMATLGRITQMRNVLISLSVGSILSWPVCGPPDYAVPASRGAPWSVESLQTVASNRPGYISILRHMLDAW